MDILANLKGNIGTISFNRPQVRNALSKKMWKSLPSLLSNMVKEGAKVIVITGENGTFAAGADFGDLLAVNDEVSAKDLSQAISDGIEAIAQVKAATIAMIDGPCLGGGCLIAAACDLRYATQPSLFSVPIARLGIVLDQSNVLRLVGLMGPAWTKDLIYSGGTIDSITAQSIGLINDFFATKEELFRFVLAKASAIGANSPASILGAKATINSIYGSNRNLPEALRGPSAQEVAESYLSADLKSRLAKLFSAQASPEPKKD